MQYRHATKLESVWFVSLKSVMGLSKSGIILCFNHVSSYWLIDRHDVTCIGLRPKDL